MQSTLELFPFAKQTNDNIEKQNKFLRKISLTGKINALDFSANLFTYTDETIVKFSTLKEELIQALVEEDSNKVVGELKLKAQLSIDVLKRNLFERTADVGFLATDSEIITFLEDENYPKEQIQKRLKEYVAKYSVYQDVLLFDTTGILQANINKENILSESHDPILKQALKSDTYIEAYAQSDIFKKEDKTLVYAQKIVANARAIGVLVLVFKFEDELQTIFNTLSKKDDLLFLEDASGVIATNHKKISLGSRVTFSKLNHLLLYQNRHIAVQTETKGYQGYHGLSWKMTAIDNHAEKQGEENFPKQALPKKLKSIIDHAHEIVDDLGDVIINGELIASKHRQYTLSPILENLRNISASLLEDINNSAENLAQTKTSALVSSSKLSTLFSIDLMDRNLYERANDCRWWALTPAFQSELLEENPNSQYLQNILKDINDLYTVYSDILLYNKKGEIIAASSDQSLLGTMITGTAVSKTLSNKNSQSYFVSDFTPSPYYHDKPTYIYHASIVNNDHTLGGIALIFDSQAEFQAILEDSIPQENEGFFIFCDADKKVISSTNPEIKPLDKLDDITLPKFSQKNTIQEFTRYKDKNYLVTLTPSKGYREYKREDDYKNEVYALSFIAL